MACYKIGYATKAAAVHAQIRLAERKRERRRPPAAYQCARCRRWHTTRTPQ